MLESAVYAVPRPDSFFTRKEDETLSGVSSVPEAGDASVTLIVYKGFAVSADAAVACAAIMHNIRNETKASLRILESFNKLLIFKY
jgi:hypothetical protein